MKKRTSIKTITYGVCAALTDLLLYQVFLVGASVGKTGSRGIHEAFRETDEILGQINHQTLATAWYRLFKKQLLTYKKKSGLTNSEITDYGRARLGEDIPMYHKLRPWDKKIFLITYDIPNYANTKRDRLRTFLKQLGCRMLAESTWLTPYNPRELVNEFYRNSHIPGTIIVSDIGTDGNIGETTISDLLIRLYDLESLNERYHVFLRKSKDKRKTLMSLLFVYLSILKDDPQLPFELLPKNWVGDKAYRAYKELILKYRQNITHVHQ